MPTKSQQLLDEVTFIVARILFGTESATNPIIQRLVERALMSFDLHVVIARTLGRNDDWIEETGK